MIPYKIWVDDMTSFNGTFVYSLSFFKGISTFIGYLMPKPSNNRNDNP